MKQGTYTLIICLWSLVGGFTHAGHADEIVMGSGDWCPYVCDPARHGGRHGYLPDIAKRIFERAGHTFSMQYLPFARAIQYVRGGKLAGIPGVYHGDVPDFIFPPEPQGVGINTFYVRKDSPWRYGGYDSLRRLTKLGVIRDYYYGEEIKRFMDACPTQVDILHGDEPQKRNLRQLQHGRIMAWVEDNQVAQYSIRSMHLGERIIPVGTLDDKLFVYIAFSPALAKANTYAQLLVEGVEQLRQSGELAKILTSYGLRDWKDTACQFNNASRPGEAQTGLENQ